MLLLDQGDKITAIDISLLPDAILQWLCVGISILMMIAMIHIIKRFLER